MKSQIMKNPIPIDILYDLLNSVDTKDNTTDSIVNNINCSNNTTTNSDNTTTNSNIDNKSSKIITINKAFFKKLQYNNSIQGFLQNIKEYYYESKQYYVTRQITYNNFLTIIRQICKINNIHIEKKIVYIKNYYDIIYYIYI
tara:strand:- start:581 stop:1006 length:426 start_codon:yes stop_codon:yes gene_type:complete